MLALFPLKLLLLAIDLLITIVTFAWVKPLLKLLFGSAPIRSVPVDKDPSHRVRPDFKGNLVKTPYESGTTLYELSKDAFNKFAVQKCMGVREYQGMHSVKPPVKRFGETQWRTYEQVGNESMKFGAALKRQGLVAAPAKATLDRITTPCSLAIFENTCPEWMIGAQGAFSQSVIVTTIYATLGMDAVIDAITDGAISAILCNKKSVKTILSRLAEMPTLKTIVWTSDSVAADEEVDLGTAPSGMLVTSFEDFVESGDTVAFPPTPPAPSSMAVLMYTSGSTGKPKGVVITHEQLVATVSAGIIALGIVPGDVYLGYLPLAHILELMAEFCNIAVGCTMCYADPKTLTVKGAYPIGALEQYSPTTMAAVPKIWDVIKKGVEAKIAASSPVAQFLVKTAFQARTFAMKYGYDTPLFKALVFKKFSKVVGGELRLALSGGGPLNSEVQQFIRTCFGIPLIQGYGLTETCAGLTVQAADDLRFGVAGALIPSVEAKVISVPDICDKKGKPYLSTDTRDVKGNKVHGRGEILCRGTSLSLGYYMMPDKTKEVFEADGFFHTGDIGQFADDGSIQIVDRVKNLVKLKGGEYIAIENMEMSYGNSVFVDAIHGGICCYGDGDMDRPIALLQLSEAAAMKWAKDNGVSGDFDSVKDNKELYNAVLADMRNEHKKAGLSHLEKLVAVCFVDEPWTPENGCLTAANKLQRRMVIEKFEDVFEATKKKGIF
jgi:long-chain acyl-CoA synthetase